VIRTWRGSRLPAATICNGYAVPTVHMSARIYPLPFAQPEDLGDAAGLVDVLAARFQFVRIVQVHHCGVAIDLRDEGLFSSGIGISIETFWR
jgi:hypothetical protein